MTDYSGSKCEVVLGNYLCLPALSRRSGDVGSLHPPRSTESKPRTPVLVAGCQPPHRAQVRRTQCNGGNGSDLPGVLTGEGNWQRPPHALQRPSWCPKGDAVNESLLHRPGRRGRAPDRRPAPGLRILGIPVGFHWTLLVIIALLALDLSVGLFPAAWLAVLGGLVLAALLFASVLAHELGHGGRPPRGGRGRRHHPLDARRRRPAPKRSPSRPARPSGSRSPGRSSASGSRSPSPWSPPLTGALMVPTAVVDSLIWLALVNGILGVFNLLPAAPLTVGGSSPPLGGRTTVTSGACRRHLGVCRPGRGLGRRVRCGRPRGRQRLRRAVADGPGLVRDHGRRRRAAPGRWSRSCATCSSARRCTPTPRSHPGG